MAEIIVNQVIGAIIGAIVSIIISWYFYKKADIGTRIASEMTHDVLELIIKEQLGGDFEEHESLSKSLRPKNLDTPFINDFWYSSKTFTAGESVVVLFRVADKGMNFGSTANIEITANNLRFRAKRHGHGLFSCKIDFPQNAPTGENVINFKLVDAKGNSNSQNLAIMVTNSSLQQNAG